MKQSKLVGFIRALLDNPENQKHMLYFDSVKKQLEIKFPNLKFEEIYYGESYLKKGYSLNSLISVDTKNIIVEDNEITPGEIIKEVYITEKASNFLFLFFEAVNNTISKNDPTV